MTEDQKYVINFLSDPDKVMLLAVNGVVSEVRKIKSSNEPAALKSILNSFFNNDLYYVQTFNTLYIRQNSKDEWIRVTFRENIELASERVAYLIRKDFDNNINNS